MLLSRSVLPNLSRSLACTLLLSSAGCEARSDEAASDPSAIASAQQGLNDSTDPFTASIFVLAQEVGLSLALPDWPWTVDPNDWDKWSAWAAQTHNSLTSLGMLPRITLKDSPLVYQPWPQLYFDELAWGINWPTTAGTTGALSQLYYPSTHPFQTFRGHTLLWYGSASTATDGGNPLPQWLRAQDNLCMNPPNPGCALDQPWCPTHAADCNIAGMPLYNPNATLRETTLRRQVFLATQWLRSQMPATEIQIDVANEMIKTIFQGPNSSTLPDFTPYVRSNCESDSAYFARVAMPYSPPTETNPGLMGARVWSDINKADPLYFLDLAFRVANAADPAAKLFLNEYDPEVEGVGHKSGALYEIARTLRLRGTPIHGVGLQFHLQDQLYNSASNSPHFKYKANFGGPWYTPPTAGWWDASVATRWLSDTSGVWHPSFKATLQSYMANLKPYGVDVAITELNYTAPSESLTDDNVQRRQARTYRDLLDACVDSGNCSTFVLWNAPNTANPLGIFAFPSVTTKTPAYWALQHGLARAAVPGSTLFEAEWTPNDPVAGSTASGGGPYKTSTADTYAFWTNGAITYPLSIPVAGTYTYDVWAWGTPANSVKPNLELRVDTTLYGMLAVDPIYTHYKLTSVLPAGNHTVKAKFTNDLQTPTEDRNIFLDAIAIRPVHRVGRQDCHSIAVRDMGIKDSTFVDYGWAILFTNGGYKEVLSVTTDGWYKLNLLAYGFSAPGQTALVDLAVDGTVRTTFQMPSRDWGNPGPTYEYNVWLSRGAHELSLRFTNDYYMPPADLNVAFSTLDICPVTSPSPQTPVVWSTPVGVSVNGSCLSKPAVAGWNGGAVSSQTLSGDGYVEATANSVSVNQIFGLSNGNTDQSDADIDFGIGLGYHCCGSSNGHLIVYENGVAKWDLVGGFVVGDKLRVSAQGTTVSYSKNGVVFYTSQKPSTFPLLVDSSLYYAGSLCNVVVSGAWSGGGC